jgi:hypothetical protein
MTLQSNMRVQISGDVGTVIGRVEEVRLVAELPDLPSSGLPVTGEFAPKSILVESGVTRVAMLSYHASPNAQFMFAALEIGGEWFDLQRQKLELEVVGLYR